MSEIKNYPNASQRIRGVFRDLRSLPDEDLEAVADVVFRERQRRHAKTIRERKDVIKYSNTSGAIWASLESRIHCYRLREPNCMWFSTCDDVTPKSTDDIIHRTRMAGKICRACRDMEAGKPHPKERYRNRRRV